MQYRSFLRRHTRSVSTALLLLGCAATAYGMDSYDPANRQLTITTLVIGGASFSNVVVTVANIVSGPGVAPTGAEDTYNPLNNELTIQTVMVVGGSTYYDVVATVGKLVSIGGVTGADTYNAQGEVTIPAVQVGGAIYTDVLITVGSILSHGGGMPQNSVDIYDTADQQLTIEGIQLGSTVYTNPVVTVTLENIKSIGGQLPVETVLYSFGGGTGSATDSVEPLAGLIQASDGNFYGTASGGGTKGAGTVFKVTPAGVESIVYSFGANGAGDGSLPAGNLVQGSDGTLYGTTINGGTSGAGTVFKLTPQGAESVLYSFTGASDGAGPESNLVLDGAGNLYGTTSGGGANNKGTVFKVTPQGVESVLWSFSGTDGSGPVAGLTLGNDGSYYGTTFYGGAHDSGTTFKVTTAGALTSLHSFGGTAGEGIWPYAGLTLGSDGNFYGDTVNNLTQQGGTVFRMTPGGTVSILHTFTGLIKAADGAVPYGGLIEDGNGNFYGTTLQGGIYGQGTAFKITPAGNELVLYSFGGQGVIAGNTDGISPECAPLLGTDGNLYGLTTGGGVNAVGAVFRLTKALTAH